MMHSQQAPFQSYAPLPPAPRGLRIEKRFGGLVLRIGRKYRLWSSWSDRYVKPSTFILQFLLIGIFSQYMILFFSQIRTPAQPILGEEHYYCTIYGDGRVEIDFENLDTFHQIVKPGQQLVCHPQNWEGGQAYLYVSEQLYNRLLNIIESDNFAEMQGEGNEMGVIVVEFHL